MAKFGFGQGGAAPLTTNNGSPGGIRPMPRPDNLGQPAPAGGAMSGFLGPKGSEARYDMAMQLLASAMSSAQGSNSPLLSFLAPIATSVIGARAEKVRDDARASEVSAMTESILGPNGLNTEARKALEIMNNPDAPDYLKSMARSRFDAATKPASAPARRRSGGGGASTARPRLYGEIVEKNGIPGKYDGTGKWWPLVGPDDQPEQAATAAPTNTGAELTDAELDELYGLK
jgi:hypothetical protein